MDHHQARLDRTRSPMKPQSIREHSIEHEISLKEWRDWCGWGWGCRKMPQLFIDIYADVFIAKYRVACYVWNSIFCIVIFCGSLWYYWLFCQVNNWIWVGMGDGWWVDKGWVVWLTRNSIGKNNVFFNWFVPFLISIKKWRRRTNALLCCLSVYPTV